LCFPTNDASNGGIFNSNNVTDMNHIHSNNGQI